MAFMSQERKKELAPAIKKVLKKYKMKGTLAVRNHSTLVVNLKSGPLDIIGNYEEKTGRGVSGGYIDVNGYWLSDAYTGKVLSFLKELKDAMMEGNWDKSDIMTDYFNVGWYTDINVGKWNKPYEVTA